MKKAVNKGKTFGAFVTNLSKAFDCLAHKFLLAKVSEMTKMNSSYTEWFEIVFEIVPQNSILGHLQFFGRLFISDDIQIAS